MAPPLVARVTTNREGGCRPGPRQSFSFLGHWPPSSTRAVNLRHPLPLFVRVLIPDCFTGASLGPHSSQLARRAVIGGSDLVLASSWPHAAASMPIAPASAKASWLAPRKVKCQLNSSCWCWIIFLI